MSGRLFMIGTPIGNLADFSPRARLVIGQLDTLYCEDTRVTGKLLKAAGLTIDTQALHDDSPPRHWHKAIEQALAGKAIGFVTDAGMPGVSDPGRKLVRLAWEQGVSVSVVPGPSSVGALLACCPFVSNNFSFLGFAPRTNSDLQRFAKAITANPDPVIFFDSPRRFHATLNLLTAELAENRELLLGREMTKEHEQIMLFTAADWPGLASDIPALGEVTIAVSANNETAVDDTEELHAFLETLKLAGFSNRDAVTAVAIVRGIPVNRIKSVLYRKPQDGESQT